MDVTVIDTSALGDRSYLVHDGRVALVVDPQRDIDRVIAAAEAAGVRITHVAETHIHNDYVTGGLELARETVAAYLVNAADPVQFERTPITDGERVDVGELQVQAVSTPGHTETHLSYVVTHDGEQAVFSGGSLLFGSVGRTDLVGPAKTTELTHAQYASVRRLVGQAQEDAALYPTHGFGSFCSSGPATGADSSTMAEQRAHNHALTDEDEAHFVEQLIANLSAYPTYYAHMGPANLKGPDPVDLTVPEPLDADELTRRLQQGEWVVDLRERVAFADGHLSGAVSFEYGDGASFTTFLGWVLPWNDRITLAGSREQVEQAIRDLSRIGIDSPDAALGSGPAQMAPEVATASYRRVGWEQMLAERPSDEPVLDVRRADEYAASHVDGSVNVPLHELLTRMDEVPTGTVWVHCGSGYRAGVAASLIQRAGGSPVHVDAAFGDAEAAGVPLTA
ncbi:rhodanese-like domain-containing protein [Serinicoccus sp. LYQ131]|uniref:rhodanese-like domain-containing protein n=1 Tax=Serinicoccus sp. LYQ131 TaxID=3378797 RepID=UPI003851A48D